MDTAMKVKSTVDLSVEWTNLKSLPEDEDFTKQFPVKDFGYRKLRKVVVYMNLSTSLHINCIKYNKRMLRNLYLIIISGSNQTVLRQRWRVPPG